MAKTYMIEAVVDGTWHWFAGRANDGPVRGMTTWASTDDRAIRFASRREAEHEQRRLGGVTYIREMAL